MRKKQRSRVPCPSCGGTKDRQTKFCRACYLASLTVASKIERNCERCGRPFLARKRAVAAGDGRFCGLACSSAATRRLAERVATTCEQCGASFGRKASEVRRRKLGKSFCSPACWYAYAQMENHPMWDGGQHERMCPQGKRWRRAVMRRDGYACKLCGATERLQVHHIRKFAAYPESRWDVANGLTLCVECHGAFRGSEDEYAETLSLLR
jgi:hypothetical protein